MTVTARVRYLDVEAMGLHPGAELLEIAIVYEHGAPLLGTLVRPIHERTWPDAEAHLERAWRSPANSGRLRSAAFCLGPQARDAARGAVAELAKQREASAP